MRSLSWALVSLAGYSSALHLPVQRVRPRASPGGTYLNRNGSAELGNSDNLLYTAEVKVGSKIYTLQLDTGSSDLWFAPDKDYNQTFADATIYNALKVNITYAAGWTAGAIAQTDLEFAGLNVRNQSFVFVEELSPDDIEFRQQHPAYQGIVGLGFDTISQLANAAFIATNSTWGRSLMSNILLANPSTPKHIAFFLDRMGDLDDTDVGYFDIGTYAPGYEAVADSPKHDVFAGHVEQVDRWNVLLHGLSVNGKPQTLKSRIVAGNSSGYANAPPEGSISAFLDTGNSAAQIPEEAFHELYKAMAGVLINGTTKYAVPCMAEAEVVFTFGNQTVAIHPLDLTTVQSGDFGNGQNLTLCTSSYGPAAYIGQDKDITLGDSFLRNVYTVYNYGGLANTFSGSATAHPFIQILPLTDSKTASAEFKQARAKTLAALPAQVDITTVNDPFPKSLKGTSSSSNTVPKISSGSPNGALSIASTSGLNDNDTAAFLRKLIAFAPVALGLLGSSVALLIVLIAMSVLVLIRLKRQASTSRQAAYVPVRLERERVADYRDEPTKYDT